MLLEDPDIPKDNPLVLMQKEQLDDLIDMIIQAYRSEQVRNMKYDDWEELTNPAEVDPSLN